MSSKRDEALKLSEELLSDIELKRLEPIDIARKASRLARLTDDTDAMQWLSYEIAGYPEGPTPLDHDASAAGRRSNRYFKDKDDKPTYYIFGLGQMQTAIETATRGLNSNSSNTSDLRSDAIKQQGTLDRVIGSLHTFAAAKYQELRFGDAVETIFDSIRAQVDANIAKLVPDALPILTTALENAREDNPIQWTNAAKACRDLLKATADALRPAGKPKQGRAMTDKHYVNRLVDWIEVNSTSSSSRRLVVSDLDDLGKRLDAVNTGGNKGAHTKVTKFEAARFIVGTYMVIGDILSLHSNLPDPQAEKHLKKASTDDGQLLANEK